MRFYEARLWMQFGASVIDALRPRRTLVLFILLTGVALWRFLALR